MPPQSPANAFPKSYRGLAPLRPKALPKICPKCGIVYPSIPDFLDRTEAIRDSSGLVEGANSEGLSYVALMTNCRCGTTLAMLCVDRRTRNPESSKRRLRIEALLQELEHRGHSREEARIQLGLSQANELVQNPASSP